MWSLYALERLSYVTCEHRIYGVKEAIIARVRILMGNNWWEIIAFIVCFRLNAVLCARALAIMFIYMIYKYIYIYYISCNYYLKFI